MSGSLRCSSSVPFVSRGICGVSAVLKWPGEPCSPAGHAAPVSWLVADAGFGVDGVTLSSL